MFLPLEVSVKLLTLMIVVTCVVAAVKNEEAMFVMSRAHMIVKGSVKGSVKGTVKGTVKREVRRTERGVE